MTCVLTYGVGYSASAPAEGYLIQRQKGIPLDNSVPLILGLHGHGGSAFTFMPSGDVNYQAPGYHARNLVEAGFAFLSVDDGGASAWGDAAALARIDDAIAWAHAQGYKTDKIGLMGYSMGGLAALNWIKRNAAKVAGAWLWAPATDLDFFNGTAGYVPAYANPNNAPQGAYSAEIQADYNPYGAGSAGFRIHDEPASFRGIAPIKIAQADDDATVPPAQNTSFVANVNDPLVTFREIANGGHTGLFAGVPAAEVVQFYEGLAL